MKTFLSTLAIASLVVASATTASAQTTLLVDLGKHDAGKTDTVTIAPVDQPVVLVTSRLPKKAYSVTVSLMNIEIPPLSMPAPVSTASADMDPICAKDPAVAVDADLGKVGKEADVSKTIDSFEPRIMTCADADRSRVRAAVSAEVGRLTTRAFPLPAVRKGQQVKVVVEDDSTPKLTWTVIFTTGPLGSWHALFGLNWTPNHDQTYHTEASGTQFQVVKDRIGRWDLTFAPSLMFTWLPTEKEEQTWYGGFTAGLGFDKSTPTVFIGGHWTFHQNIGLVGGVSIDREKRLAVQYDPNNLPLVKDALTADQLSRTVTRANLFFGVMFRFDKNPLSTSTPASTPAAAKDPAKGGGQ